MRLQLALNVDDLDAAIDFYSRMFGTGPAKLRPGYANFAIADPPLKLVLFEGRGEAGTINHLGVETETADEVEAAEARLSASGLETTGVDDTMCCYAAKTETWLEGPDGTRWEWYVKTGDTEQLENVSLGRADTALAAEIRVYDPVMCCSTGVCGTNVDPTLAAFAADLDWLAAQGADVRRINLGQEPGEFAAHEVVRQLLTDGGEAALPAVFVNGELRSSARFPSRDELAGWAGAPASEPCCGAPEPVALVPAAAPTEAPGTCEPDSGCC